MNVRRGIFRVWIVASVLWMLGSTYWLLKASSDTHQTLVDMSCKQYLGKDDGRWSKCWDENRGPEPGSTWFTEGFKTGNWILIFIPPLVFGGAGFVVFRIGRWVKRGFDAEGAE